MCSILQGHATEWSKAQLRRASTMDVARALRPNGAQQYFDIICLLWRQILHINDQIPHRQSYLPPPRGGCQLRSVHWVNRVLYGFSYLDPFPLMDSTIVNYFSRNESNASFCPVSFSSAIPRACFRRIRIHSNQGIGQHFGWKVTSQCILACYDPDQCSN